MNGDSRKPLVSVIVPVLDASMLADCLTSLERQTYPNFEVVVVDNGAPIDIGRIVNSFSRAALHREETPGSYAARNRGIVAARGAIFAFTDADCRPRPSWLSRGVQRLTALPEVGAVGGHIEVTRRGEGRATLVELYESKHAFPQERYIDEFDFAVTANLFTRRSTIENIGPFRSDMESAGDHEWGQRLVKSGYRLVYEADAVVDHPPRTSWSELHRKYLRVAKGELYRNTESGNSSTLPWGRVFRQVVPPLKTILKELSHCRSSDLGGTLQYSAALTMARCLSAYALVEAHAGYRNDQNRGGG